MTAVTFDTLKFVETLKAAGIPDTQAKAMAEAHKEALAESAASLLATKEDIADLKQDFARLEKDFARLEQHMTAIEGEIKLLKWMLGFLLAGMVAVLVRLFV
jgi:flagellar motility protein MotE (MotC chaperone)